MNHFVVSLALLVSDFLYITRKPTHISAMSVVHRTTASHRCSFFSKAFIHPDPALRF